MFNLVLSEFCLPQTQELWYYILMDSHKVTKRSFRMTVLIAVILSALLVAFVSILGRSAVQLQGALVADAPDELTVAVLSYEATPSVDLDRTTIVLLPKRGEEYDAYGQDKSGRYYFIRIREINANSQRRWQLAGIEPLHEGFAPPKT